MRGVSEKFWKEENLKALTSMLPREVFVYWTGRGFVAQDSEGTCLASCDSSRVLSSWAFSEGAWAVHHRYDLRLER